MLSSLALLLSVSSLQGLPGRVPFKPAKTGDLLAWLVAGPFPNPGSPGFDIDRLGGEAAGDPSEDSAAGDRRWRFAAADVPHGLDLREFLRTDATGVAYCFTNLYSPAPRDTTMDFGSDDGVKVFLNGKQIFSHEVKRGIKRDEEHVSLHLQAGMNRLLFKVEQYDGGWGLTARLLQPGPVVEAIGLQKGANDRWAPIRHTWNATGGAIDIESLQNYWAIRKTAQTFQRAFKDRASLRVALRETENTLTKPESRGDAFNQDVSAVDRKVRGAYTAARKPLLDWAQHPGPLWKTSVPKEDYIRVMKGGHYFAHPDGAPFIPIGGNHNPDWPDLIESYPLNNRYDPAVTDRWFAKLKANGVDVIRLMVETPPSGNLEERIGVFRPEHVIWLDNIFQAAKKYGVKLWITPYDTFWMSLRADASPYWKSNGGLIDKPIDFLTKPSIIDAQKRRMRYLIDRYGNSGTVFAWEIMNEIDLWWNASPEQIRAWEQDMATYVRSYEKKKWGRNHLVAMSMATPEPRGLNAETEFRSKDLDFATMHLYLGVSKAPKAGQAVQAGIDYAKGVTYALTQIGDARPSMDGESGPIDHWIDDPNLDDEVFHQMSWRHLMAGGAGSGTRWPYRHPHELSDGMLATLRSMRTFCDGVDWSALVGVVTPTDSGFRTPAGVLGWSDQAAAISIPAKRGGVFDVKRGAWIWQGVGPHQVPVPAGTEVAWWAAGRNSH